MEQTKTNIQRFKEYVWMLVLAVVLIVFGLCMSGVKESFIGLGKILTTTDSLISDYFEQGSIGGAFLNAGLLEIIAICICLIAKKDINGNIMAPLFFFMGFALFGKNLINVWPILFGVFLYCKVHKIPFRDKLAVAFLGCTMAPIVSEVLWAEGLSLGWGIVLCLILGTFLGYVLPQVAQFVFRFHEGYSIFNTGFAGGIILTAVVSLLKVFNFKVERRVIWYSGNKTPLMIFMFAIYVCIIIYGIVMVRKEKKSIKERMINIFCAGGRQPDVDYCLQYGKGTSLINVGMLGVLATLFVVLVGADLNGPTIGAIFATVGYGAAGVNLRGAVYIYASALIGHFAGWWNLTAPTIILGALFAVGLAPLAEKGGPVFAFIATALHLAVVQNTSDLHYGLSLYNNGFSCGIVAGFVRSLAVAFKLDRIGDPILHLINGDYFKKK